MVSAKMASVKVATVPRLTKVLQSQGGIESVPGYDEVIQLVPGASSSKVNPEVGVFEQVEGGQE